MVGTGTAGSSTQTRPGTRGEDYGREVFENAGEAERVFAIETETTSVFIQAHPDNNDNIFIGWDDNVDSNTGVILEAGAGLSFPVDVSVQNLWAVAAQANDEIRYIALG